MSERAEYWSRHLAAIATEGISTQAYAKREGLAVASLYYWRKRLNTAHLATLGVDFGQGYHLGRPKLLQDWLTMPWHAHER